MEREASPNHVLAGLRYHLRPAVTIGTDRPQDDRTRIVHWDLASGPDALVRHKVPGLVLGIIPSPRCNFVSA